MNGVHAGGHTVPVFDPINNAQVQQALRQAGISLKVASPVDSLKGATAERTLGGLVVTFQPGAFEDAIPSPIGDQLRSHFQPDQTVTVSIGGVAVNSDTLAGYGGYVPPPTSPPTGAGGGASSFGSGSMGTGSSGGFSSSGGLSLPVPSGPGSSSSSGGTGSTTPVSAPLAMPPVRGVPAGLAVAGLLIALCAALGLRVLAERAVAAAAQRCPHEEMTR